MKKLQDILKFLKNNKRFTFFLIVIAAFYVGAFVFFQYNKISQSDIQKYVEPFGAWGLVVLLGVQILFSLTPMPDSFMPILAYLIYGPLGVLVISFGMYIGGVIHYFIGHRLGREFIVKHFPQISKFLVNLSNGNTILKLVYLRMFSVVSFDITSYIAGITNIPFRVYTIAFVLGIIPNNLTIMLVSSGLFAHTLQDQILIWIAVILAITLLAYLYKRSKIKIDSD